MFPEFESLSKKAWNEQIEKELKGRPLDSLTWRNENFDTQPFYRPEDLKLFPNETILGNYIRNGSKPGWKILQEFDAHDPKRANELILDALANNCSSILLNGGGIDHEKCLENVIPEIINIYLSKADQEDLSSFKKWLTLRECSLNKINGGISYAPLSDGLTKGEIQFDWQEKTSMYLNETVESPQFKVLKIDGSVFENSGATIVQQLTYAISLGHEYLSKLSEIGSIDDISPRLYFEMNIGSSYFIEIAKLRALRILWAKILKAFSPKHQCSVHTYLISNSSSFMLGIDDHKTNLIRNTNSAMCAAIGNSDEVCVRSHEHENNSTSYRLARNIQNLLKEESHIDKVADPSGGSHYIDHLTFELCKHAWDQFMKLEISGGYLKNIENGTIQDDVSRSAMNKVNALNNNGQTKIGSNKYRAPDADKKYTWSVQEDQEGQIRSLCKIKCLIDD